MHARLGHLWSAQATHAAMPHLPVPSPCRRTTHLSDRTGSRLSQLSSSLAKGEALAVRKTRPQF
jgi:hypothetical protein